MKVERQPAFVLRTQSYKETSLLVDIFSRDHGRQKPVSYKQLTLPTSDLV